MTTQETYADKIAKLLRKAESTTPEEAELLLAKAQELMAKYAIDEAMLAAAKGENLRTNDPIVNEELVVVGIYRFPLSKLVHYISLCSDVKCLLLSDPGWRKVGDKVYKETVVYSLVGYKSDIERVKMLHNSLMIQAMRAENAWWRENQKLYAHEKNGKKHQARRGFLFAFADGAWHKLSTATARGREAADKQHGKESVALVLRDKSLMVQDEFQKLFPHTRSVKDRKNHGDAYARSHGYEAGRNADVGQPGVGSQSGGRKQVGR